jgi:hypothetical protein
MTQGSMHLFLTSKSGFTHKSNFAKFVVKERIFSRLIVKAAILLDWENSR